MAEAWLSSASFAQIAGISRRVANRLLGDFHSRGPLALWHGVELQVRTQRGRGGRSGVSYVVKVRSLPAHLQERLKGSKDTIQLSLALSAPLGKRSAEILWWSHHLTAALSHPPHSRERASAIEELAGKTILDWHNRPITLGRSTIYTKLAKLEGDGLAGVARARRKDAGRQRVLISREWDQAVPFDDATRALIAGNLQAQIRGLRAKRTSRKIVLVLAQKWLEADTVAHGFRPNDPAELARICQVPMKLYAAEARYEVVYDLAKDRDRFDNQLPRVKRSIAGLRPMEWVMMDVHPVDVLIRRQDGTSATARLIAFMDVATKRVWCELLFVEGVGGVRNTDVVKAFIAMAQHPSWGLPENLYCDNGSEYLFADFLDDALQLNGFGDRRRGTRIVRALPYNAAAKGQLEGWFHRFEVDHLRHVQGWHGGKLGAPKRPARGKLPQPYAFGFEAFAAEFMGHLRAYEVLPQHGQLKGLSPDQSFARHVAAGWAATLMNPEDLLTVFTRTETRIVSKHGVSVDGRGWNCPELDRHFGRVVQVKVPVLGFGFNELWIGDEGGQLIGIAKPDVVREFADTRQAHHSADRKRNTMAAARGLQKAVPEVNVGQRILALGQAEPRPGANPHLGSVSVAIPGSQERAIVPVSSRSKTLKERQDQDRATAEFMISTLGRRVRQQ